MEKPMEKTRRSLRYKIKVIFDLLMKGFLFAYTATMFYTFVKIWQCGYIIGVEPNKLVLAWEIVTSCMATVYAVYLMVKGGS